VREQDRNGFTLIEVVVAAGLVATIALGVAPLFKIAAERNRGARLQTLATLIALQKVEEIKSLDPAGLARSPAGSLDSDIDGYFDHVDVRGAAFVRRWSIAPRSAGPAGVMVIQVLVAPAGNGSRSSVGWRHYGARVTAVLRQRP
jgi:prepilin-type N-terminal cleavage/methylation domain-containing protein